MVERLERLFCSAKGRGLKPGLEHPTTGYSKLYFFKALEFPWIKRCKCSDIFQFLVFFLLK